MFASLVNYVRFFPAAALAGLLLAGLNVPISEDLVIITGALVSRGAPGLLVPSLLAIYAGVVISDFISFFIGTLIRKGVVKAKFATALLSPKKLDKVRRLLDKNGFLTFIVCRFIPLGVRNTLFMASGFLALPVRRFAVYDIIAAAISVNTLFFLVYCFGEDVENPFRIAGLLLFALLCIAALAFAIRFIVKRGIKIPLTRYGFPQVVIFPVLAASCMAVLFCIFYPAPWLIPLEGLLFLVLVWMLSFFRDPARKIPPDESVLLSPADGTVTDIGVVDNSELGAALKIGIFLSVFNVHLNRAPCSVRVEKITYKKGMFKDARSADSSQVNESNALLLVRLAEPRSRLLVRQISGAIARHIVCGAKEADELGQGERFGMIKFGSRTELYIPASEPERYEVAVKPGDAVRAGLTPLIRYR
ncbi:MAG: phosphatidylserine decarboxylase [Spirochaetaceae bacterium]|jgi:phosphatidylserine decarboxylase|nr:phosphatidylserine decarboxylase [Spirochaetaceae bacterium]